MKGRSKTVEKIMTETNHVLNLAKELFGDEDLVDEWMNKPNEHFFNMRPIEVCMNGNAYHVVQWLKVRLEKD